VSVSVREYQFRLDEGPNRPVQWWIKRAGNFQKGVLPSLASYTTVTGTLHTSRSYHEDKTKTLLPKSNMETITYTVFSL
jgi:hypothetical protein